MRECPVPHGVDAMSDHRHIESHHHVRTLCGHQRPSLLARMLLDAVIARCPECRRAWELLTGEQGRVLEALRRIDEEAPQAPARSASVRDYHAHSLDVGELQAEVRRLRRLRQRWRREIRALRRRPTTDARRETIESARRRYRAAGVATLLLDGSRSLVRTQPAEAERLAALVGDVIERVPDAGKEEWAIGLAARAEAHRANALRVSGDLPAATAAFARLRARLAAKPLRKIAVEAEVASLEASLCLGQREAARAEELLVKSLLIYRQLDDQKGEARIKIKMGMALYQLDRPLEALVNLEGAAGLLDPDRDHHLMASTVSARVALLCKLDRAEEAERLLARQMDLYEAVDDPHAGAMFRHLQGRVALGLGRLAEAEELLVASREVSLALGRSYDAILTSLDLACVYLESGKDAELGRLAQELLPTFRSRGVHPETLAALSLVARAVARQELTRQLLARLRDRVEASRESVPKPDAPNS